MNKYLAINIGPISDTLSMARKPRELWAASYLFSHLMEWILKNLNGSEALTLISPYYEESKNELGVGLYPDRSFYLVNSETDIQQFLGCIVSEFAKEVGLPADTVNRYFNIMVACNEYNSPHEAISGLNNLLDYMELNRYACDSGDYETIYAYLRRTTNDAPSPLFPIAFGKERFKIETLEKIANAGIKDILFSRQKYACIVQADGDGMGSIVKSNQMDGKLHDFSKELMEFGKQACGKITSFGGLPIYAGGDDLLFIAPVCSTKNECILDLIDSLDEEFKNVQQYLQDNQIDATTSMSYGIAVIYYKYPLYEAWEAARNMLFSKAKKVVGKNAVAINLRKNSGSSLQFRLNKNSELYGIFKDMINNTPKESIVSAIAHKIRANDILLATLLPCNVPDCNTKHTPSTECDWSTCALKLFNDRLNAFYDKVIDIETKSESEKQYMELTKKAFARICELIQKGGIDKENEDKNIKDIDRIIPQFYSMLRIAKFINGEKLKDE